jgi:hypothetical protein
VIYVLWHILALNKQCRVRIFLDLHISVLRDDNGDNYLPLKIVIGVAGRRHKSESSRRIRSELINKLLAVVRARGAKAGRL